MWLDAQHVCNLLVRQTFKNWQSEHLAVSIRQLVYQLQNFFQWNTFHSNLFIGSHQGLCFFQWDEGKAFQMVFVFWGHVSRYRHHPRLSLTIVSQTVKGSEDNHKSIVQHIVHRLFITDITTAYTLHSLGVCLVQFSERICIALSASFYQPCYLHREHNVSIYIVLQLLKRLHEKNNFFIFFWFYCKIGCKGTENPVDWSSFNH